MLIVPLSLPLPDPRDPRDKPDDQLTFGDLECLEASDDPFDRERAERMLGDHRAKMEEAFRPMTADFERVAESLKSFDKTTSAFESLARVGSLADDLAKSQEEQNRTMAKLMRADAERAARKAAAEHAAIETPELLDALIEAAKAQDTHLTNMAALLEVLTVQAAESAKSGDKRWAKSVWFTWAMLFLAGVAAVVGVWALLD